jgi:hypothetical protein
MRAIRFVTVITCSLLAATAVAAPRDCDRKCLAAITGRYLDALVKHTPRAAPLSPGFRYTENAVEVPAGAGLWQTASALGGLQRIYVDPVQGQSAFFGLINEGGVPAIVSLRLKIVARKVTEAEAIIGRKGVSLYEPQNLIDHGPGDQPLPASARSSREAMIAAAASYFDGAQSQNPAVALQKPGCDRYENGMKTTNRKGPGPGGVSLDKDCAGSLADMKQIAAVVDRRYPVVDEVAGVVMGTAIFNRPPGAKRADGTLWPRLLLAEFFPIESGRFTAVYAAMYYLPPTALGPGWPN